MAFAWRCPFCGHHSTIGDANFGRDQTSFFNGSKHGKRAVVWIAITCPNSECREFTLTSVDRAKPAIS